MEKTRTRPAGDRLPCDGSLSERRPAESDGPAAAAASLLPSEGAPATSIGAATFCAATWNVNSIRRRLPVLLEWLDQHRPDALGLQETKVEDAAFPREALAEVGYRATVLGQKQYNGVATLTREAVTDVFAGFDGTQRETEKRLLAVKVAGLWVVNVYLPNGGDPLGPRFGPKLDFLAHLRTYFCGRHLPSEPILLLGDFNVAPEAIDVYDPRVCEGRTCFHPQERHLLRRLAAWGWHDLYRLSHPQQGGCYTWWDMRSGAWLRDEGLRIDHIWGTASLRACLQQCAIDKAARGRKDASDHAPLWVRFAWE